MRPAALAALATWSMAARLPVMAAHAARLRVAMRPAARDPLAARPCQTEAPGRAGRNGPTVAMVPQTIFYFFKKPQVSLSQWLLFTRIA